LLVIAGAGAAVVAAIGGVRHVFRTPGFDSGKGSATAER
jgi:hypothetical protein